MYKVNNRNTRTRCEICLKLMIKTSGRRHNSDPTFLKGGANFNDLPRRGESEKSKERGRKYGARAGLLKKGEGLTLFLFKFFKAYHFYI